MHDYEIRIVTPDYRISHTFASSLPSDFAAIRRAHVLTRPGHGIEVWRGVDCIYANHRDHPLMALIDPAESPGRAVNYEIRILREDRRPSLIWNSTHPSDAAAIRAGVQAAHGHAMEVWRDSDCIFRAAAGERPA